MTTSLLNLISTPIPILNTLGLDVAVGLSSEDPIGGRRPSEPFTAFLTVYDAGGALLERLRLGEIAPHRRRLFDVTAVTRRLVPSDDHLVVVHRIPARLLADGRPPETPVELAAEDAEFSMYRSLVQYSYPGGANGSVIYETPPGFNVRRPGRPPANTLTFTPKIVLADDVHTCLAVMHYSIDPAYAASVTYDFSFLTPDGTPAATGTRRLSPFTVSLIEPRSLIPAAMQARWRDASDGLAWFTYIGCCAEGSLIPLVLTLAPRRRAVAVEHTHPAQAYTIPPKPADKNKVKGRAVGLWTSILAGHGARSASR